MHPELVDVSQARILLDRAANAPLPRRAELLADAAALWRGHPLSGIPNSVRAPELHELWRAVHGVRVDADLELGRYGELIAELTPMVREDPLAERTVGQLMRALYHAGRRADALEVYRQVAHAAVAASGIEPGPELSVLHERILHDDVRPAGSVDSLRQAEPGADKAGPVQLPLAVAELAGRHRELAWLDELLEDVGRGGAPVGVVTGQAGVGKSALVVCWAHHAGTRFPDGVLFATLRGFDANHPPLEPEEVLSQFLLGLGVAAGDLPEQQFDRVALYRTLLADKRLLVVLDDARTSAQVEPLLPPGSGSMTVVTSRLRLDGLAVSVAARTRALGTLPASDAVQLIEDLAGHEDAAAHRRLAQLCGYLPLALRIVGARLAAMPQWDAEDLLDELEYGRDRLAALELGGSHASVRAAFDVSRQRLPGEVGRVFRLLGGYTGHTIGPNLAAAICDVPVVEARDSLRVLAEHHLLTETARDVFAPHDLVRRYMRDVAETELSQTEGTELSERAMRYYLAAADRARRRLLRIVDPLDFRAAVADSRLPPLAGFDAALDWFDSEWSNLLATLESASAAGRHSDVWQLARIVHTYRVVRPIWQEWTRLVEIGMAAALAADSDRARYWMLISRCAVALTFGLREGSLADAEAARTMASEFGDGTLAILADVHVGCALTLWERHDAAITCLRKASDDADRIGDLALVGQALANCAEAEKRAGLHAEAISHQLRSLGVDRRLGDDSYAVVSLNNLAEMHLGTGELDQSQRYATEAIELAADRGLTLQEGVARFALGRALRGKGEPARARAEFVHALDLHEQVGRGLGNEVRAELDSVSANSLP